MARHLKFVSQLEALAQHDPLGVEDAIRREIEFRKGQHHEAHDECLSASLVLYHKQEFELATQVLHISMEQYQSAKAFHLLGLCLQQLGEHEDAVHSFLKAFSAKRAISEQKAFSPEKAISEKKAINLNKSDAQLINNAHYSLNFIDSSRALELIEKINSIAGLTKSENTFNAIKAVKRNKNSDPKSHQKLVFFIDQPNDRYVQRLVAPIIHTLFETTEVEAEPTVLCANPLKMTTTHKTKWQHTQPEDDLVQNCIKDATCRLVYVPSASRANYHSLFEQTRRSFILLPTPILNSSLATSAWHEAEHWPVQALLYAAPDSAPLPQPFRANQPMTVGLHFETQRGSVGKLERFIDSFEDPPPSRFSIFVDGHLKHYARFQLSSAIGKRIEFEIIEGHRSEAAYWNWISSLDMAMAYHTNIDPSWILDCLYSGIPAVAQLSHLDSNALLELTYSHLQIEDLLASSAKQAVHSATAIWKNPTRLQQLQHSLHHRLKSSLMCHQECVLHQVRSTLLRQG